MTVITYPTVYALDKANKIRLYGVEVNQDPNIKDNYTIKSWTGVLGGSLTYHSKKITAGKQKRTVEQQAIFVAESLFKEKRDEGYKSLSDLSNKGASLGLPEEDRSVEEWFKVLSIKYNTDSEWRPLPMLAEKWIEHKKKVKYPILVQPKFDGVRCLAMYDPDLQEVILVSRGGSTYTVPHLQAQLTSFFLLNQNLILDGELYYHGKPLQEISGEARKGSDQGTWLEYHIYDFISNKTQHDRNNDLRIYLHILQQQYNTTHIKEVVTIVAHNEEEVVALHNDFVSQGYEGAIGRNPAASYLIGFRDKCLLKIKEFQDEEFEIVGCEIDPNKTIGESFVFRLKNNIDDQLFLARPTGTLEQKNTWYVMIEDLIGRKVTVRFPQRSNKGIPMQGHVRHTDSDFLT